MPASDWGEGFFCDFLVRPPIVWDVLVAMCMFSLHRFSESVVVVELVGRIMRLMLFVLLTLLLLCAVLVL